MKKITKMMLVLGIVLGLTSCSTQTELQKVHKELNLNEEVFHLNQEGTVLTIITTDQEELSKDNAITNLFESLELDYEDIAIEISKAGLQDLLAGKVSVEYEEYTITIFIANMSIEIAQNLEK